MSERFGGLRTRFPAALMAGVLVWALFAGLTANVSADSGGGDTLGYSWTDSNSPSPSVAFDWIDITGIGIDSGVTGDDLASAAIPLGFTFDFYGVGYTSVYFSTNGLITLGGPSNDFSNDPIPSVNTPNLYIAPYWDDLCVNHGGYNTGKIYYQTIGSSPDRQFIVEWWEISRLWSSTRMTFEAILNETGDIWFQYYDMNGMTGTSASVGLENTDGTVGSRYSYNEEALSDSLAVRFSPTPIGISPSAQSGSAHPGDSVYYGVTITNHRGVTDSFDIECVSEEGWDFNLFDSLLNPLTDSNSNGIVDTGDVASAASVDIYVQVVVPADPDAQFETTTVHATSFVDDEDRTAVKVMTKAFGALFSPPHEDSGNDTDGDGLYNLLLVNVSVDVSFEDYYIIDAYLYDNGWGFVETRYFEGVLEAGEQVVTFAFTGWKLNMGFDDGPYNVEMIIWDWDWNFLDYNVIATDAYTYDEFDEPPAWFEPPYSDHGVDLNSNAHYDALVVTVPLTVTEQGTFHLEVFLWDEFFGGPIELVNLYVSLDVGVHDVEVWFDGRDLWDYDHDGSYIAEMTLRTEMGDYLDYDVHFTEPYLASEFEPPGASLSLSHAEYGLDTNENTYYDFLVIEVSVHVYEPGSYSLTGVLSDSGYNYVDDYYVSEFLDAGIHTIELWFSGKAIYYYGYDGQYYVEAYLFEDDMDIIHQVEYETEAYLYDEFEPPGARLDPPYEDSVLDTNGNGYYDYLLLNISVDVMTAGTYFVTVYLYDFFGWYVDELYNETYLDVGIHEVQVVCDGLLLYSGAHDGPYEANIYLQDDEGYWLSSDLHWTAAHSYTDFEPPGATFSPPHEDSGLDADSDGWYDYLSVNVTVEVVTEGDYFIDASLWPVSGDDMVEVHLEVGTHVVQLLFDGRPINRSEYIGTIEVDIWLLNSEWTIIDFDIHLTGTYGWNEFEAPPVSFSPPHSDYGLDVSGGSDYEYLVVEASLEVTEAGLYRIEAVADGFAVDVYGTAEAYLEAGMQSIPVLFPAWPFYASGEADLYWVSMDVYDESWTWWDDDAFDSGTYQFDEFNGSIPTIASSWTDTAPTIDGVMDPDEWNGAGAVDLVEEDPANEVESMLIVMNNATHLFICYDVVGDFTEDGDDISSFSFDTGNDEEYSADGEDQFAMRCEPGISVHYYYNGWTWVADCSPFDPELTDHEGLAGAYGFGASMYESGDHRIFEYAIPLSLIEAEPGEVLGFCVASMMGPGVVDDWDWTYSTWPNFYGGFPNLAQCGDIVLAPNRPMTTATVDGLVGGGGWYVSEVTVTLLSSGGDGGVDYTMYRIGGGSWQTYTGPFEVDNQGTVLVEFYSVDTMGNEEDVRSVTFMADSVAPETSHEVAEGYEVTLTAVDAASGPQSTYYRIDGGVWTIYSGPVSVDDTQTSTVEYYSVDNAGNVESIKSVELDEVLAPNTVAMLIGGKGLGDIFVSPSVMVILTASDNAGGSGVASTMYSLNGGTWTEYPTEGIEVDEDGNHTVEFYSVDNAGNEETPESVEFVIDSAAPTTSATVVGTNVTLSASDAGSGVDSTMYRVDGGDWTEYDGVFSVAAPGNHTVDFYSVDSAGNVEMVKSTTVQNAPAEEPVDGEEDEGGGVSSLLAGAIGLIIGAVVVLLIMMMLMRRRQPGSRMSAEEPDTNEEDDLPPPPT